MDISELEVVQEQNVIITLAVESATWDVMRVRLGNMLKHLASEVEALNEPVTGLSGAGVGISYKIEL